MAVNPTIKLRSAGTALTNSEIDQNFSNLKDAVVSVGDQVDIVQLDLSSFTLAQNATNGSVTSELGTIDGRLDSLETTVTSVSGQFSDYVKRDGSNSFLGNINAGSNKVVNIATPVDDNDAATKKYVDDLDIFNFKTDGSKLLTGNLNLSGNKILNVSNPVDGGDASNKTYVDTGIASAISAIDFTPYLKSDGSVSLTGNLNSGSNRITNAALPIDDQDVTNKQYVLQQKTFTTETFFNILNADVYAANATPATWAYEFSSAELKDKIVFNSNVDTDNITFPNKSYIVNVKFADNYVDFPDNYVDLKLVNRSSSKLIINVYLNDGVTKIASITPNTFATLQWKGSDTNAVWLITLNKNFDLNKKASNNFLKFAIAVNANGTIKTNHNWLGQQADGSPAFSININHTSGSGIYNITWTNNLAYDGSGHLFCPVVIPSVILTSADSHEYIAYTKDLSSTGCIIEISKIGHTLEDKDFSLVVGGHNSPTGDNFNNPFLV